MGKVRYKELSPQFEKLSKKNNVIDVKSNIRGGSIAEVLQISPDRIKPYEKQARKRFDEKDIEGLEASIREVGIISPLLVIKSSEIGFFNVINGERRLRAAKKIGLERVPCIILENTDKSDLIAVIDNIQRVDLHPVELSSAYDSLIINYGDKKLISEKIGIAYTSFLETLKLKTLPEEIQRNLLDKNIRSRAIFRRLLKVKDISEMKQILGIIKNENKEEKRVKIIEIYSKEDEIFIDFSKNNFSKTQKENICSRLKEIIEIIQNGNNT